jgi:hypothetical protein
VEERETPRQNKGKSNHPLLDLEEAAVPIHNVDSYRKNTYRPWWKFWAPVQYQLSIYYPRKGDHVWSIFVIRYDTEEARDRNYAKLAAAVAASKSSGRVPTAVSDD